LLTATQLIEPSRHDVAMHRAYIPASPELLLMRVMPLPPLRTPSAIRQRPIGPKDVERLKVAVAR